MRETLRQIPAEQRLQFLDALAFGRQKFTRTALGQQINLDRFGRIPVGGDLQDSRAAQTMMRDQNTFVKLPLSQTHDCIDGYPGERTENRAVLLGKNQRDERRLCRRDSQPELPRQPIAEIGRAYLRNRQPAGRNDERFALETSLVGFYPESAVFLDRVNVAIDANFNASTGAFATQHENNIPGASVAKHLADLLFVVGDPVLFNQEEEILRCESGQRRLVKVRIGAGEAGWNRVQVGEVATTAAADQDLFANFCSALEYEDRASPLSRVNRAHDSGSATADDNDIFSDSRSGHQFRCLKLTSFWRETKDPEGVKQDSPGREPWVQGPDCGKP